MKKTISLLVVSLLFSCQTWNGAQKEVSPSNFGMHMHDVNKQTIDWPTVPFAMWRLWDAGVAWGALQPREGEWEFDKLDLSIKLAEEHGVTIALTLGYPPDWASMRPDDPSAYIDAWSPAEPRMEAWRTYVQTLAERYKGKILYWEIWNEPDQRSFYTGTITKMVELAKEASKILKQVDSRNQIIAPSIAGWVGGLGWLDNYLGQGGGEFVDIIGYHYYSTPLIAPESLIGFITHMQQLQQKHHLKALPIWCTEMGNEHANLGEEKSLTYMARMMIITAAMGVELMNWYAWDNKSFGTMYDKKLKEETALAEGYRVLYSWLVGKKVVSFKKKNRIYKCVVENQQGEHEYIVWGESEKFIDYHISDELGRGFTYQRINECQKIGKEKLKVNYFPIFIKKSTKI